MSQPSSFFVYGTLKRAQLRGNMWPCPPLEIVPGCIQAELYDLGPYPAITPGQDWVLGEIWRIRDEDMFATTRVLDRIEGFVEHGKNNEYVRSTTLVDVLDGTMSGEQVIAYTYFWGDIPRLELARRIPPSWEIGGRRLAEWPDAVAKVPKSFAEE